MFVFITLLPHLALYLLDLSLLQGAQQGSPAFVSPASQAVSLVARAQIPPAFATTRELAPHCSDLVHVSPPVAPYPPLFRNHLFQVTTPAFAPYPPLAGVQYYKDENAMVLDENSHLKRSHQPTVVRASVDRKKKTRSSSAMTTKAASRQHRENRRGDEATKLMRALTTIQRWWRLQKQIALNGIDTADYHGDDFDDL
jgi:hypothetical protein